jgi:CheY-like chemotaxis protein
MSERVLLVDDEKAALSGMRRALGTDYDVTTATSADECLEVLKSSAPFAVVVADYHMGDVDGLSLFESVFELSPNSVRLLLVGKKEIPRALEALDSNLIFRFQMKPFAPEGFANTVAIGVEHYRLQFAERAVLEETLRGMVHVLSELMAMLSPRAFGRAVRLRILARRVGADIGYPDLWEVEVAAMLSQIGCVTVPQSVLERRLRGQPLTPDELRMFDGHPHVARDLLARVPRIEAIARAIGDQMERADEQTSGLSRIIQGVTRFDELMAAGRSPELAINSLRAADRDDPFGVIAAIEKNVMSGERAEVRTKRMRIEQLKDGMVLAEDVQDKNGVMLIAGGFEVTEALRLRLLNLSRFGLLSGAILVEVG